MKERTINDLHDKEIGHSKMAKVCDLIIAKGHKITNIKEYNEKFKFDLDGYPFEYDKNWKSSAKDYATYCLQMLDLKKLFDYSTKGKAKGDK